MSRYLEGKLEQVISALIQVESSGGLNLLRHEPRYRWIYKPAVFAVEFGISLDTEVAQQKFSYGPMQIMGATARELGYKERDLRKLLWVDGIEYGIKYLIRCADRYPALQDCIAAFNAGSVRRLPNGKYVNQGYVDKVMGHVR